MFEGSRRLELRQDVAASRLEGAFVVVHLNRFQQIAAVYTLLAQSEQVKVRGKVKIRGEVNFKCQGQQRVSVELC